MSKKFDGVSKSYRGRLKEIGPSTTDENERVTYRYIEIGDNHIPAVEIMTGLDGKLRNALKSGEEVKLEVFEFKNDGLGKMIVGISYDSGSAYASQWSLKGFSSSSGLRNMAIIMSILSIVFFPFLFAGLFFVPGAIKAYNNSIGQRYIEILVDAQNRFIGAHPGCVVIQEVLR